MATRFHSPTARVNGKPRRAFHVNLRRWYRASKRDLPWRRTSDPYKIWVSEIMLQQTRVEVVRDYYARWLRAFPTIEALARASDARVLKMWEGLGYYARARNLHRAAKIVVGSVHCLSAPRSATKTRTAGTAVPTTSAELQTLPGIGRYTACAIASIAFDERVPVVDGNVARVLARVLAIRASVKLPRTQNQLWSLAEQLMPRTKPGDFNQAMMELGALVCTPRNPQCPTCPLRHVCRARQLGLTEQLPNRGKRTRPRRETVNVALVRRGGRVLLRRRDDNGLLAGMWELPTLHRRQFQVDAPLFELRHTITNR